MTWTPELIIGVLANASTAVIATALILVVLGPKANRLENSLFALLMALFASTGLTGVLIHFAQPLAFHPRRLVYLSTTLYGIGMLVMFLFSARFVRLERRVTLIMAAFGLALLIVVLPSLWNGQVYTDFEPAANGAQYHYRLATSGLPGITLMGVFQLLSAGVLYHWGGERARWLWLAPLILLAAMLLLLIPFFQTLPPNAVAIAISSLLIARIVMDHQVFNPLAQANEELRQANTLKSQFLTQLAEANSQLSAANAELAAANQLKSQFLANMSHELRTPLNSIIGYTELVLNETYGPMTELQADRLTKVVRNGRNLLALINDILDLSKIEAGRMDITLAPLALDECIDRVLAENEILAKEKQIALVRDYADLPPVLADSTRAQQIVLNLVSNAIKFTHEGTITVRGRADKATGTVRIDISDTGIGIAEADLPYIFDEFRQADGSTTRRYEGTGLGLAITKRLVEMHGGSIWAQSTPDDGSTFSFTLPMAEAQPEPARLQAQQHDTHPDPVTGPLAVVIDDSPEAAELIQDTLQSAGYTVLWAQNGVEGLALAQRTQPHVITLDVMMPGMNGWEVLEQLKTHPDTAEVPVVIVSIVESKPVGLNVAPDAHLTKPVDRDHLVHLIHNLTNPSGPVLVVDDNPQDREILSTILRSEAYPVATASGGQQAIDWLAENRAVLVLLDLIMPDVSGFDVLQHIRTQSAQPDLPVIVVSAKDLTPDDRRRLDDQWTALVRKQGLFAQDLLGQVQRVLAARAAISRSDYN